MRCPDGRTIAYRVAPASAAPRGIALALLHGLASNLTRWSEFVEHCALRGRHDIIRIDLRGHGGSDVCGKIGLELALYFIGFLMSAEAMSAVRSPRISLPLQPLVQLLQPQRIAQPHPTKKLRGKMRDAGE